MNSEEEEGVDSSEIAVTVAEAEAEEVVAASVVVVVAGIVALLISSWNETLGRRTRGIKINESTGPNSDPNPDPISNIDPDPNPRSDSGPGLVTEGRGSSSKDES